MLSLKSTLLTLTLGSFAMFAPQVAPKPGGAASSSATPSKFVGVYLSDFQSIDLFTGLVSNGQVISNYNADGTLTQSDTNDAVGMLSATAGSDSPAYGTWTATGPTSTTQSALWFSYNDDGGVDYTARSDWDTDASNDLSTITGSGTIRIYFPGMDPLDESIGIPVATFTFDGRTLSP